MRTPLIMAVVALVVLFVFNPEMEAFRAFAERQSERLLLQETGETALGRVLSGAGGAVAGVVVERAAERDNYLVFSIYTLDFDGPDEEGEEWRFLGILGTFLELDRPEALEEDEAP